MDTVTQLLGKWGIRPKAKAQSVPRTPDQDWLLLFGGFLVLLLLLGAVALWQYYTILMTDQITLDVVEAPRVNTIDRTKLNQALDRYAQHEAGFRALTGGQ